MNSSNPVPEKWFIKRKPHIAEKINEYFTKLHGIRRESWYGSLYSPIFRGSTHAEALKQGYKELSYEDFCKHVIKETPFVNNSYEIF